jgi:hypothetical protein
MKNKALVFALVLVIGLFSCNSGSEQSTNSESDSTVVSNNQKSANDYSGVYKTTVDNLCQIILTITKDGQNFNYQIKFDNIEYAGKLLVENTDGETYFTFDGLIDDNKPKTVSGKLVDGSIMIQNYGNSMNEYHYFKKCDEKYLEFKK